MIATVCTGLVCMTAIIIVGLLKGHNGTLIGVGLSTIAGIIGAVIAHYKTKKTYTKGR